MTKLRRSMSAATIIILCGLLLGLTPVGAQSAENSESIAPRVCPNPECIMPDPYLVTTSGDITAINRSPRDRERTYLIVVRNSDGKRVARKRITIPMPARSIAVIDVRDVIDFDDLEFDDLGISTDDYTFVVRNVRKNGKVAKRNTRGKFTMKVQALVQIQGG